MIFNIALMKKFNGLFAGFCVCCVLTLTGRAQVNTVKIMPMGDSVTARGSSPESSYRYWLWKDLQDAGFNNFVFLGNQNGVSDGAPANPDFDQHYEGGGSGNDAWSTANGVDAAPSAAGSTPDFLILDLGSNDIIYGIDPATTQANLQAIIEDFVAANPNIIILLAKPTPFAVDPVATSQEKKVERRQQSQLASIANNVGKAERRAGINVIVVNQFGGYNVKTDTKDGTHPNVRGEQKIARKYFTVLKKYMRRM
jgi:lysophospholipase L1-like esterase